MPSATWSSSPTCAAAIWSVSSRTPSRRSAATSSCREGYRIAWGGQFENQQRAAARLVIVVPVALLLIFLLLFSTFGSVRQALLVLANIPFALIGGVFGAVLVAANTCRCRHRSASSPCSASRC